MLKDGKKLWALARTGQSVSLKERDEVNESPRSPRSFNGGFCPVSLALFHGTRQPSEAFCASFRMKGDLICAVGRWQPYSEQQFRVR